MSPPVFISARETTVTSADAAPIRQTFEPSQWRAVPAPIQAGGKRELPTPALTLSKESSHMPKANADNTK